MCHVIFQRRREQFSTHTSLNSLYFTPLDSSSSWRKGTPHFSPIERTIGDLRPPTSKRGHVSLSDFPLSWHRILRPSFRPLRQRPPIPRSGKAVQGGREEFYFCDSSTIGCRDRAIIGYPLKKKKKKSFCETFIRNGVWLKDRGCFRWGIGDEITLTWAKLGWLLLPVFSFLLSPPVWSIILFILDASVENTCARCFVALSFSINIYAMKMFEIRWKHGVEIYDETKRFFGKLTSLSWRG